MWIRFLGRYFGSLLCAILALYLTHNIFFAAAIFLIVWTYEYLAFMGQNRRLAKENGNAN